VAGIHTAGTEELLTDHHKVACSIPESKRPNQGVQPTRAARAQIGGDFVCVVGLVAR
jgi:hypothetical protein